jgi:hypothetical protein
MSGLEHLLDEDRLYLERKAWDVDVTLVGDPPAREILIVIHNFSISEKYTPRTVDLLIRQLHGYPVTPIDSWLTNPTVFLADNPSEKPAGAASEGNFLDRNWQSWSRHPAWRSGVDNLETFMAIIIKELRG